MSGLYSVTALRENDQERVTVYTKHRLKLHSQTTLTNDGGLKNLDMHFVHVVKHKEVGVY